MDIDVTVLRVFTDPDGNFGNPLGVVNAGQVAPAGRQRLATELGYSETVFVDIPVAGSTTARRVRLKAAEAVGSGRSSRIRNTLGRSRPTPVDPIANPAIRPTS